LSVPSFAASGEDGIAGTASLLFDVATSDGTVFVFAGDPTKLYRLTAGSGFSDVSKGGGYTSAGSSAWKWARYGDFIYLVNGKDAMQEWELGVDSQFADAAGIPTSLTGRYICVLRDFLVLAHTTVSGSTTYPAEVRWSALGDPSDWTASATTLSGAQTIPDLGEVRGLAGGDYMTVLCEHGVVRVDFVGPPAIMQFDQIDGAVGCREAASVIRVQAQVFYLADEGWHMFDGQRTHEIGSEKIDRWFFENAQLDKLSSMSAIAFPELSSVGWLFTSESSPDELPDRILLYNYSINRWGLADAPGLDCLGTSATVGLTLEDLDTYYSALEDVPASLDSPIWKGSNFGRASGIKGGELYYMTGETQEGVIDTIEGAPNPHGRWLAQELVPLFDGSCTIYTDVGTRNAQNSSITWQRASDFDATVGRVPLRHQAKFFRFRTTLCGDWNTATGVEVNGRSMGRR
jgi:hypothetical protein